MSARLIGELVAWLQTPAAADLTAVERCVLFAVAERCHESTRVMLRHRSDEVQLADRLAAVCGVDREYGLKKAFQRLAKRGLDVRIPLRIGKDGRPVFACEGHSMRFQLPRFPASVELGGDLRGGPPEPPSDPVENPVDNTPGDPPPRPRGGPPEPPSSPRGGPGGPPSEPRGGPPGPPISPSKEHPSEEQLHPSVVLHPVADVEDSPAEPSERAHEPDELPPLDFEAASAFMRTLDPVTDLRLNKAARSQLGPRAPAQEIVIRAAQLAVKGIPA